jgi:hypothetical protein
VRSYANGKIKEMVEKAFPMGNYPGNRFIPPGNAVTTGWGTMTDVLSTAQTMNSEETLRDHPNARLVSDTKWLEQPDQYFNHFADGPTSTQAMI